MSDHNRNESELRIVAERAALPFKLLEQMRVPCGYERSFRMLPGRLLANRYLLGVDLNNLHPEQLRFICQQLNMPEEFIPSLNQHLSDANLVFFGFEDNPPSGLHKVYLEFWERVKSEVRSDPEPLSPKLLHLGFKWDVADNARRTISKYLCYPMLSTKRILQRLGDLYAGHEGCGSLAIATEIIAFAASHAEEHSFIYLEVLEEDGLRRSFDINLYSAMLPLRSIQQLLVRLREHFAIPSSQFEQLYRLTCDKLLGHISGGISQCGEEFLTVYYEADSPTDGISMPVDPA